MEDLKKLECFTDSVIHELRAAVNDANNQLNCINLNNQNPDCSSCHLEEFASTKSIDVQRQKEKVKEISGYSGNNLNEKLRKSNSKNMTKHKAKDSTQYSDFLENFRTATTTATSTPLNSHEMTPRTSQDDDVMHLNNSMVRLLNELNKEKKINKELQEKISKLEEELADEQLNSEMMKLNKLKTGDTKISEVIEEIYKAQKMRENIMIERIKAANHDRDEALLRAKALSEDLLRSGKKNNNNSTKNLDVKNILSMIEKCNSSLMIHQYGNSLVEKMQELREARLNQTAEEIKVILQERDGALEKCKKLESKINKQSKKYEKHKDLGNCDIEEDLQKTIQERDSSIEKLQNLEEEVETLRVYYNLNKSLAISQDQELMDKYNTYLTTVRDEAAKRIEESKQVQNENKKLQQFLKQVTLQRNSYAIQNQKITTELNEVQTKCKSLERLVKVLRQKLMVATQSDCESFQYEQGTPSI